MGSTWITDGARALLNKRQDLREQALSSNQVPKCKITDHPDKTWSDALRGAQNGSFTARLSVQKDWLLSDWSCPELPLLPDAATEDSEQKEARELLVEKQKIIIAGQLHPRASQAILGQAPTGYLWLCHCGLLTSKTFDLAKEGLHGILNTEEIEAILNDTSTLDYY
eukprot:3192952-Rhodomonas_salina.5